MVYGTPSTSITASVGGVFVGDLYFATNVTVVLGSVTSLTMLLFTTTGCTSGPKKGTPLTGKVTVPPLGFENVNEKPCVPTPSLVLYWYRKPPFVIPIRAIGKVALSIVTFATLGICCGVETTLKFYVVAVPPTE